MISDRIYDEVEWPGRRAQGEMGGEPVPEAGEGDEDETVDQPTLLGDDEKQAVRERLDRARSAVDRLESEASRELDEAADISLDGLPESQSAAKMLAGTHPEFGTEYPEPDESEKMDDEKISGPMIRRAYRVMENPGRNGFGVDLKDVVLSENEEGSDNPVEPYQPITSPDEATGVKDPGRGDSTTLPGAFEKSAKDRKLSMWKKLAYAAGGYLFKFIERVIRRIANRLKGAFSVGIPGPIGMTINLSKPITWGLNKLADLFGQWAEDLLEKALGNDPAGREMVDQSPPPDSPENGDEASNGLFDTNISEDDDDAIDPAEDAYPDGFGDEPGAADGQRSAGPRFLEASERILRTASDRARADEDPKLAQAMDLYDRARTLRRDLNVQEDIARAWGAPAESEAGEEVSSLPEPDRQSTAVANDDPTNFKC